MSKIVISGDALLEFFASLSLTNKGNGVYIYSGKDEIGDEPGAVTTLKGLAANDDDTFFGSYVVEAEVNEVEEFYLTSENIDLITNIVSLILDNYDDETEDAAEEESDEDFYVAVKLDFSEDDNDDTKITISPATGDRDRDNKFGGFLTQAREDNSVEAFPARQIARVIRGEGLNEAPLYVDRLDINDQPVPVPDGNVVVWESGTRDPLGLALAKARSMKLPLAVEKFHASRIHAVRIGDNWFGAIAPLPLNKEDLSDQGVYADSQSLNAEYDFTGLRDDDEFELEEPTQFADEDDEEFEGDEDSEDSAEAAEAAEDSANVDTDDTEIAADDEPFDDSEDSDADENDDLVDAAEEDAAVDEDDEISALAAEAADEFFDDDSDDEEESLGLGFDEDE